MYDASSLGNHEFDDGVSDLAKFATEVKPVYPLLACNLVNERYFFLQNNELIYIGSG